MNGQKNIKLFGMSSDQADMWRVYPSTSRGNSSTFIQSAPCVRRICQMRQSLERPLTPRILVNERHVKIQSTRDIRRHHLLSGLRENPSHQIGNVTVGDGGKSQTESVTRSLSCTSSNVTSTATEIEDIT